MRLRRSAASSPAAASLQRAPYPALYPLRGARSLGKPPLSPARSRSSGAPPPVACPMPRASPKLPPTAGAPAPAAAGDSRRAAAAPAEETRAPVQGPGPQAAVSSAAALVRLQRLSPGGLAKSDSAHDSEGHSRVASLPPSLASSPGDQGLV